MAAPSVSRTSPTAALVFEPVAGALLYANYSEGLEQGGTAPDKASNRGDLLAPLVTEQIELGAKLEHRNLTYTAAIFELEKPFEFTRFTDAGAPGPFVRNGVQRHRGIEFTVTGRLLDRLDIVAGTAYLDPKTEGNTATDGKRPVSVPRLTGNLFCRLRTWRRAWAVRQRRGLSQRQAVS
ncbi:MAG: TonB-dependent receptor domain-containing protein [Panacagrimonas sp.]